MYPEGNREEIDIKVFSDGKNIIVKIPIDTLYFAENNRQYAPLEIHNKTEMVEYVLENFLNWGGDQETGSCEFEDFLDKMFDDALESGEEWLDYIETDW